MSMIDRLSQEHAPAWRPQPGDTLVGEVVSISEREGAYGAYPIVTVRQDDGTELALHAFHTVAANELAKAKPKAGEQIGVKYGGEVATDTGGRYHRYKIVVERDEPTDVDWSKYGAEADPAANAPPASDLPDTFHAYGQKPTQPARGNDDDVVPF